MNISYSNIFDLVTKYPNQIESIKNKYINLLKELTLASFIDTDIFLTNISNINNIGKIIIGHIGLPEDVSFNIVVSGTIIIEPKIIRGGKNVGHIEDIVVSSSVRGLGLSQIILNKLKDIAKENNCYKVILDCSEDVKYVYIKNGFQVKEYQLAYYF